MLEYLIKRTDGGGDWFNLPRVLWSTYLRPTTIASEPVDDDADYTIQVEDGWIGFNYEVFAMHTVIEGQMSRDRARQLMAEILANIEQVTGQRGEIAEL